MLFAVAVGLALSCSTQTADARRIMVQPPPPPPASPYTVELISPTGLKLQTYQHRGRMYVLGSPGQRYTIRVNNPTARRVEAVISVDGLDVIDGRPANYRRKRGYVVPAHGSLNIDGFRVSTSHVAAFRFSSVANSYAGRKGKARNVGVVGVAIFAERARRQLIVPRHRHRRPYDRAPRTDYGGTSDDRVAEPPASTGTKSAKRAPRSGAPAPRHYRERRSHRPGLGTKFGERRYSAANWTRFERANATTPIAIATLRYNDSAGLQALGIPVPRPYYVNDTHLRETANPFPGRFARPPRYR